jgi:signal peptidase
MVRPELLRSSLRARPLGSMLRRDRHAAATGVDLGEVLTVVAEPVESRSFWQVSVARRRAAAADLGDAVASERRVRRALALGLLLRELDGVRLAIWLVTPWLLTLRSDGPFRVSAWWVLGLLVVPAVLRWWALRALHRAPLHPLEDALALAYDAPGSVLAVPAAVTRRVRPSRPWLPSQPLALAALVFGGVAVLPLFDAGTTARRSVTVGLALTELGLLWLVTMRAIFQRNWSRAAYRVRVQLPVRIDGRSLRTRDMSPGGLGVVGEVGWMTGSGSFDVEISMPDGGAVTGRGTVANRWRRGDEEVVGLAFTPDPACQGRWLIQLERSAHEALGPPRRVAVPVTRPAAGRGTRRWLRWALAGGVGAISVLAIAAACLSAIGMRPLVVRSGSMRPALQVGDVVLVEDIEAADLRPGDIATLVRPDTGDTLTHRVVAVDRQAGGIAITTRGDANPDDEITTVAVDEQVGRVRWRVPAVGRIAAWAGHTSTRIVSGVVAGGLLVGAALIARRRRAVAPAPMATRS